MKNTSKIFFFLLLVLVVFACGPKKDTIIRRNYQALVTRYNVLFNGKEALNQGIEELNNNYKDDWFERLPIEPIAFEEDKIIAQLDKMDLVKVDDSYDYLINMRISTDG